MVVEQGASWRQRKKAQLKERLREAALKLFREQGYEGTTVQQITEAAGVAKGTFFNHFASKERVLVEFFRAVTLDALRGLEGRGFADSRSAVLSLIRALAAGGEEDPVIFDTVARAVYSSEALSEEERDLELQLQAFYAVHVASGKASGELDPQLDEKLFTDLIAAVLTATAHEWVLSGHGFDLTAELTRRVSFLFQAARPRP